jgi:hypothetical protein
LGGRPAAVWWSVGELNPNGLLALRFFVKTYVITFRFTSSATLMRHHTP